MFLQNLLKKDRKKADIILVGLGNPGANYKNTPHNAGFEAIDLLGTILKEKEAIKNEEHKKEYALYEAHIKSKVVLLVKPLLFMNRSGFALQKIFEEYEIPNQNIWIVHDDIDLPLSSFRVSHDSSSAGNKGVQNIIDTLNRKDFYRFRIGIKPSADFDTNIYVTEKLEEKEKQKLENSIRECILYIVESIPKKEVEVKK